MVRGNGFAERAIFHMSRFFGKAIDVECGDAEVWNGSVMLMIVTPRGGWFIGRVIVLWRGVII